MVRNLCIGLGIVLGVAAAANGLLMLVSPLDWYFLVPGVTTTGPFNQHFVRDIGLMFLFIAAAFLFGAAKPQYREILWAASTLWLAGHALFHFWEVAVGICEPSVIARDSGPISTTAPPWGLQRDSRQTHSSVRVLVECSIKVAESPGQDSVYPTAPPSLAIKTSPTFRSA